MKTVESSQCSNRSSGAEKASREDNRKQDPTPTCAQSGVKIEHCSRCPYETYRFTIGDEVGLAHAGPPSDLAEARRAAIAFLAQREREYPPGGVSPTRA